MLGAIALMAVAIWAGRLAVLGLAPALATAHRRAFTWAMARPGSVAARLAQTFDPDHPATPGLIVALGVLVGASIGLAGVLEDVVTRDQLVFADRAISHFVSALRNDWTDPVMLAVTALGDAPVTAPLAVLLVAWLAVKRQWQLMLATRVALGAPGLAVVGLKALVHMPRPEAMYSGLDAFAFSSGHTTMAATLYGLGAWLVAGGAGPAGRVAAYAASFGWVVAIAASRVYLGAHWPSDVIAGVLIGAAVCATVATFYRHAPRGRLRAAGLAGAFAAVFLVAGTSHVVSSYDAQVARYTPHSAGARIDIQAWWQGEVVGLPRFRVNLAGEQEERLIVQWLGEPAQLRQALVSSGWTPPPPWTLENAAALLTPDTPIGPLPAVTRLHDGAKPVVTLVRQGRAPGTREVFRAWDSGFVGAIDGVDIPVLVGSTMSEHVAHPGQMLSLPLADEGGTATIIEMPGMLMRRIAIAGSEVTRAFGQGVADVLSERPAR